MSDTSQKCKVVLLGESGVGKTCIISRYINNTYDEKTESTNGASYASKTLTFEKEGKSIKFDIWDTAGQEKYRALTKFFYKDALIAILVFDITRRDSFEEIKNYWYQQLKNYGEKNTIIGIAGNKCDLFDKETVQEEEARAFAKEIDAVYYPTSASNDIGIEDLFRAVGKKYIDPEGKTDEGGSGKTKPGQAKGVALDSKKMKKRKSKEGSCCN